MAYYKFNNQTLINENGIKTHIFFIKDIKINYTKIVFGIKTVFKYLKDWNGLPILNLWYRQLKLVVLNIAKKRPLKAFLPVQYAHTKGYTRRSNVWYSIGAPLYIKGAYTELVVLNLKTVK